MLSKRVEDLIPDMQPIVWQWINKCHDAGCEIVITCTARTQDIQDAYYAQGREDIDTVNKMRIACGLWTISEQENGHPVTWTKTSNHVVDLTSTDPMKNKSHAVDFAVKINGLITWEEKYYEICGKIGESLGLHWGGNFKNPKTGKPEPDRPHLEWHS